MPDQDLLTHHRSFMIDALGELRKKSLQDNSRFVVSGSCEV